MISLILFLASFANILPPLAAGKALNFTSVSLECLSAQVQQSSGDHIAKSIRFKASKIDHTYIVSYRQPNADNALWLLYDCAS